MMYPETKLVLALVAAFCFATAVFGYVESLVSHSKPALAHIDNRRCFPAGTEMLDELSYGGCAGDFYSSDIELI